MSRRNAPTAARRKGRPVELAAPMVAEIAEDAFHRAREAATAHTNTAAGETFTTADAIYARVNARHFRIEPPHTHVEALTLLGRSSTWRRGGGR
ncbi:MAG: hypothetical protein AB7O57_18885 [Hyphomicrobiaceae bacterium]